MAEENTVVRNAGKAGGYSTRRRLLLKKLSAVKFLCAVLFVLAAFTAAHAQTQTASFNLSWQDNSKTVNDQEDGFSVERRQGQTGTFAEVGKTGQNVTTFADAIKSDPGNVEYCYRVRAFNSAGNSGYSNIACGTTPIITVIPSAPSGVNVSVSVTVTVNP
jgi:hypothetical protein